MFLRQSTSQVIRFGPCLDKTDGVTEETALTLVQADMRLSKDGGAFAQKNTTGNATHDSDGWYSTTLDATDTAIVGILKLNVHQPANMLPVWETFYVIEEEVYDDLFATSGVGYLKPVVAGNDLDVTATGAAGIDWGNIENKTTVNDLSATDIQLVDTTTANTDMRGTDSAALASVATEARLAELDAANLPADVDNILTDTGTTLDTKINDIQGATFATGTDSLEAIRDRGDAAWTTGAGGNDRLLMVDTTIATLASQTSFTLTAGSADDDAYNNLTIVIEDVATSTQKAVALISDYTGATKTVTLKYDPAIFTMAATDKVYILAENALKSTDFNRQLDVSTGGEAGLDWGNIGSKSTVNDLSGTDIQEAGTVVDKSGYNLGPAGLGPANADTIWDTGMTDQQVDGSIALAVSALDAGTAQAGAATTITLDAGSASTTADLYNGTMISLIHGTGAGQARIITDYTATTRIATVEPAWIINPDSTTKYNIRGWGNTDLRTATQTSVDTIEADTDELQIDWANGGRLDNILDARMAETSINTSGGAVDTVTTLTGHTAQTGDSFARLGAPAGASVSADILVIDNFVDDLETRVPDVISLANINAEVDTALDTTIPELGVGVPAATPTVRTGLMLLYMALRGERTTTATVDSIKNDALTTIATAALSDDTVTFKKGEYS